MITKRRFAPALLVLAGLGALALGLTGSRAETTHAARPNVVMIVVDDMRFDEYGAGGHTFLETPHIDALAAAGASFTNAYHATPLCSPNRASLLTGQYASRHGVLDNTSRAVSSHRLDLFAAPKDWEAWLEKRAKAPGPVGSTNSPFMTKPSLPGVTSVLIFLSWIFGLTVMS